MPRVAQPRRSDADLVPIVPVADNFLGVAASATLKVDTLAGLVSTAKAQLGKLNWAATPGLPYYIVLALMKSTGIDLVQVSYRDFAPATQDPPSDEKLPIASVFGASFAYRIATELGTGLRVVPAVSHFKPREHCRGQSTKLRLP
jgi:hypothetical protein